MRKELLAVFVIVLLFCFFGSAAAQKEAGSRVWFVEITCPGDSSNIDTTVKINPADTMLNIKQWDNVRFIMDTTGVPGCDSVKVRGNPPIGHFSLTYTHPDTTIIFTSIATYRDTVIAIADTARGVIIVSQGAPTLTEWGIIILVALLVGSAVFIMLRRRKATVPA